MAVHRFWFPRRCVLCGKWARRVEWVVGITIGDYGLRCLDRAACRIRAAR